MSRTHDGAGRNGSGDPGESDLGRRLRALGEQAPLPAAPGQLMASVTGRARRVRALQGAALAGALLLPFGVVTGAALSGEPRGAVVTAASSANPTGSPERSSTSSSVRSGRSAGDGGDAAASPAEQPAPSLAAPAQPAAPAGSGVTQPPASAQSPTPLPSRPRGRIVPRSSDAAPSSPAAIPSSPPVSDPAAVPPAAVPPAAAPPVAVPPVAVPPAAVPPVAVPPVAAPPVAVPPAAAPPAAAPSAPVPDAAPAVPTPPAPLPPAAGLTGSLSGSATVTAGQSVTYAFSWSDGDGTFWGDTEDWGDGVALGSATKVPCGDAPPRSPGAGTRVFAHTWTEPGTYQVQLSVSTQSCTGPSETVQESLQVLVVPAP